MQPEMCRYMVRSFYFVFCNIKLNIICCSSSSWREWDLNFRHSQLTLSKFNIFWRKTYENFEIKNVNFPIPTLFILKYFCCFVLTFFRDLSKHRWFFYWFFSDLRMGKNWKDLEYFFRSQSASRQSKMSGEDDLAPQGGEEEEFLAQNLFYRFFCLFTFLHSKFFSMNTLTTTQLKAKNV